MDLSFLLKATAIIFHDISFSKYREIEKSPQRKLCHEMQKKKKKKKMVRKASIGRDFVDVMKRIQNTKRKQKILPKELSRIIK